MCRQQGQKLIEELILLAHDQLQQGHDSRVPLPRTRSWACPQNTELGKQIGALGKRLTPS